MNLQFPWSVAYYLSRISCHKLTQQAWEHGDIHKIFLLKYDEGPNRLFLSPQNVQTFYGSHPASYSIGTGVLPRGQSGRNVKLSVTMSVVILLLSLHAILERKGTALRLPLFVDRKLNRKCNCEWNR